MNENELYHYGVLGMKWGVRRYQNADGSLTDAGRKHYGGDLKNTNTNTKVTWKEARTAKKNEKAAIKKAAETQKKRQEVAKKAAETRKKNQKIAEKEKKVAEKEELTKEQQEKLKEEIIAKGDYKKALSNMEMFTNQELDAIITRHGKEMALRDLDVKELKAERDAVKDTKNNKIEKFERVSRVVKTASDIATNMSNMYNSIAKASNAIFDSDLPVIGENKTKEKKPRDTGEFRNVRYEAIPGNDDYMMRITDVTKTNADGSKYTETRREWEKKKTGNGNN